MDDRWPKGSRGPRSGRAWLVDSRGRSYRLGGIVSFHVYFQPAEGKLWNRLYRDGRPLRLPALISRAEFCEEVGHREGAYQLQPVDGNERPIGDPPSMLFLPGASTERPVVSSDGVTGLGGPAERSAGISAEGAAGLPAEPESEMLERGEA